MPINLTTCGTHSAEVISGSASQYGRIYEREVRARVEAGNHGKVVAIDIETGAYALDENALAAKRLRARGPNAEVWFVRVGHRALHRIGLTQTAVRGS